MYIEQIKKLAKDNKYTNWYCNIISNAISRESNGYIERHHILPKSFKMGGEKDDTNIVKLTAREHFICHLLMTKMFGGYLSQKMCYAFKGLISVKNKYQSNRISSNIYKLLKESIKIEPMHRVYLLNKVKYFHKTDPELVLHLNNGWSLEMTAEYKIGRVGNMKGKSHSENTKEKMRNIVKTPERNLKISNSVKSAYSEGRLDRKGENNTNFGKIHSEETRKKISLGLKNKETIFCPHCGFGSSSNGNIYRWHFDKCKQFKKEEQPHKQ